MAGDDPALGELVNRAAAQITVLVRDELALARQEVTEKARRFGVGGGLFGLSGVLASYGVGLVIVLAVVLLDLVWPLWAAVLVVALIVLAAAGIAALLGRRELKAATPPVPTETVESVRADAQAVREAVQEGRQP